MIAPTLVTTSMPIFVSNTKRPLKFSYHCVVYIQLEKWHSKLVKYKWTELTFLSFNSSVLYAISTLRLRQNVCHFADDVFKCIFLNENFWISNNMSMKCVSQGLIDNISLIQVVAWCHQATSHYLNQWWLWSLLMHICHPASLDNWLRL